MGGACKARGGSPLLRTLHAMRYHVRNLLLGLLPAAACLLLPACGGDKAMPKNLDEVRRKESVSESYNILYLYSDSGRVTAKLKAKHDIERYDNEKQETYHHLDQGFVLETYGANAKLESTVRANTGKLYQKRGYAEAIGNVVLTSVKGEVMETEKLFWYRNENRIQTDENVKIVTKDEIIFGQGLESNTNFTRYKIYKIRGTMQVRE
jgi:LPS export ABC transporter protein LptC